MVRRGDRIGLSRRRQTARAVDTELFNTRSLNRRVAGAHNALHRLFRGPAFEAAGADL